MRPPRKIVKKTSHYFTLIFLPCVTPVLFRRKTVFHNVLTTVFYCQKLLFKEVFFVILTRHILTMPPVNKHFDSGAKRATIGLWRAKVPQRNIMKHLGMSKATLMRFSFIASVESRNYWAVDPDVDLCLTTKKLRITDWRRHFPRSLLTYFM